MLAFGWTEGVAPRYFLPTQLHTLFKHTCILRLCRVSCVSKSDCSICFSLCHLLSKWHRFRTTLLLDSLSLFWGTCILHDFVCMLSPVLDKIGTQSLKAVKVLLKEFELFSLVPYSWLHAFWTDFVLLSLCQSCKWRRPNDRILVFLFIYKVIAVHIVFWGT